MKRFNFWLPVSGMLLFLSGCSLLNSQPEPVTTLYNSRHSLELTLEAGYDLNPNDLGEASPVRIRLYELQAADLFNQADFLDLFDQDSAALQDSLIRTHRIPVQRPGQHTQLDIPLNQETRYIAVLAEFSRYQDADARVVAPVAQQSRNIGHLTLDGNNLFLQISPERNALEQASDWWQQKLDIFPTADEQNLNNAAGPQ